MAKKKYIAIYEGKANIFYTWKECKEFVDNKKGVLYKGFLDPEEDEKARQYIDANIKKKIPFDLPDVLYAYVDGSYNKVNGEDYIGYGCVFVKNLVEIDNLHGRVLNSKGESMNQVTGELEGACLALEKAIKDGEKRVVIIYDFVGIEAWANGSWSIKNDVVKAYIERFNKNRKHIAVDMIRVDSHQAKSKQQIEHQFNDRADELAKMCWKK